MRFISRVAAVAIVCCASLTAAVAATKADVQAVAEAAVNHVKKAGAEQAAKDFNSASDWKTNGINVNFIDMKGYVLASSLNERLRGKQTLEMKDPNGKEFVKEFVATAQKGEGWVEYQFINPETKKLEPRAMFVRKVPNTDTMIAVAVSK
jgi:cytochrome c